MKKLLLFLTFLCGLYSFSYASNTIQLIKGIATGDNLKLNFDSIYSDANIDLGRFKQNVCGLGYSGYEISGYVDTETVGYAYFSEPDGDNTVNSCVGLFLSGLNWYVKGTGAIESNYGDTIYFNDIKLVWDNVNKNYYFSGKAITSSLGEINLFTGVYISGLDLIDWSKTIIDYSNCTGGSVYANGQSCNLKIVLKNSADVDIQSLSSISGEIILPNGYENKIFLSTGGDVSKTFSVTNGVVNVPIYFLKPVSGLNLDVKLSYSLPDIDGNSEKTLNLTGIKILNPIERVGFSNISDNIIGDTTVGDYRLFLYSTGLLNNNSNFNFSGFFVLTGNGAGNYEFVGGTSKQNGNHFSFVIQPNDTNYNQSVVDVTIYTGKFIYDFGSYFNGATGEYTFSLENVPNIRLYADKRVDWTKSEIIGLNFSGNDFMAIDSINYPKFRFVLRNYKGYVIPDVSVDLLFKDNGVANSYSGWDCDEITNGYQVNCKGLLFYNNGNYYFNIVNGKLGAEFNYKTNRYMYSNIGIISLKPITGDSSIYFEIKNIRNTSSLWSSFENSGSYIGMSLKTGNIVNLHYLPQLNLDLKGLDAEDNYIDINNKIYVYLKNKSAVSLSDINYKLFGKITYPTDGSVGFTTGYGDVLTGNTGFILSNQEYKTLSTILLTFNYIYDSGVVLNYNSGYYTYEINNFSGLNIGKFKLKPWSFWFDLGAKYKFGGVFVLGLINKVEKWSASVKNVIGRNIGNDIDIKFVNVYNRLLKTAYKYILSGVKPETNLFINPNNLSGGVKYYKCNDNEVVIIGTGTYGGKNTLLIENCRIFIKGNVYKESDKDNLVIFAYSMKDKYDILSSNYLENYSNIFIAGNVSDIQASLLTKGSIITINQDQINENNIIVSSRTHVINDKQLVIQGSIMAKNTIGGSFLTQGNDGGYYFVLPGGRRIYKGDNLWGYSNLSKIRDIMQIFDVNFFRGIKSGSGKFSYDDNWFSAYCKSFGNNIPEKCKYPVIIIYDPTYRQSILFK